MAKASVKKLYHTGLKLYAKYNMDDRNNLKLQIVKQIKHRSCNKVGKLTYQQPVFQSYIVHQKIASLNFIARFSFSSS